MSSYSLDKAFCFLISPLSALCCGSKQERLTDKQMYLNERTNDIASYERNERETTLLASYLRITSFLFCIFYAALYFFNHTKDYFSKGPGKRGHIVADTLLRTHCCRHKCFPVCPARNICCGHKFCVRDKCFPVCAAQDTSWATMCPQQCVLVYQGLESLLDCL